MIKKGYVNLYDSHRDLSLQNFVQNKSSDDNLINKEPHEAFIVIGLHFLFLSLLIFIFIIQIVSAFTIIFTNRTSLNLCKIAESTKYLISKYDFLSITDWRKF